MSPTSLSFRSTMLDAVPKKGADKDALVVIPPLNNSPIDVLRDARDYERQRQHSKKSAGLVKAKERKERGLAVWAQWGDKSRSPAAKASRGSWFGGKDNRPVWDADNDMDEKDVIDDVERVAPSRVIVPDVVRSEVKLADLVTSKKSRKAVGGDFEVIPAPRNVIVLDDFSVQDMDVDEPWELVTREEEKARGPSYAQVVSTAK